LQHGGRAWPQRAIGKYLHAANAKPIIPKTGTQANPNGMFQAVDGHVFDDPQAKLALFTEDLEGEETVTAVKIMETRQARLPAIRLGRFHRLGNLGGCFAGDVPGYQFHRVFKEDAGGFAGCVALNLAAGWVGGVVIYASDMEGTAVHPGGVAGLIAQANGDVWGDAV
jgi:hypothetical protein